MLPSSTSQRGASLIGLMVGMVISLLAVMGALSLFKTTTKTVFGADGLVPGAMQDGQQASALLSAQMALQGAGYGITAPATGTHMLLVGNAVLDAATVKLSGTVQGISAAAATGNAVVWVHNPGLSANAADFRCMGLLSDSSTRALVLLQSSGACEPLNTEWNKVVWRRQNLVAAGILSQPISFTVRNSSGCWPFGAVPEAITKLAAPSASVSVALSYGSSVTGSSNTYTSCLSNLVS